MTDEHPDAPADPRDQRYNAPLEQAFERVVTPFEEFIHHQTTSGVMLMLCALIALAIANSPLAEDYTHLLHARIGISIGAWTLENSLQHWVNDGLMTLFFFMVGLEIKREILVGELASMRRAALPIVAAIGGMIVPALIYAVINPEGIDARGWGIPMATDIAFAVGVLVLLGRRVTRPLIMFLVALAIVDDLGAVLVIAIFYTEQIAHAPLIAAALLLGLLILFNLVGIRKPLLYFLVGTALWLAMLQSGVHATIAGVLLALTIPARAKYDPARFSGHVGTLMNRFDDAQQDERNILTNNRLVSIVQTLEHGVHMVQTPLQRLEHALHLPVALLVIPIFALANAGVPIAADAIAQTLARPVTFGVMLGLILGKFVGITGASWLALRLGIGSLPANTTMRHIAGVALLGGIGFTMSIFIAELAFAGNPEQLVMAKTGILGASVCAGVAGYLWLLFVTRAPASE